MDTINVRLGHLAKPDLAEAVGDGISLAPHKEYIKYVHALSSTKNICQTLRVFLTAAA